MSGTSERRVDPRYTVDIVVDCTTQGLFVSHRVTNISKGGLFIQAEPSLPIGSEIALTLTLPVSGTRIHATGRVAWNYDVRKKDSRLVPGMGIKFVDMGTDDRAALEDCLAALAAQGASGA
jgi:uncharacterized protein (TIGR02266 family)